MNWKTDFDWDLAIKHHSEALKSIVAALFAMLDVTVARIPLPLHRAVLRVLRPAESAVRRLVVIAARGLVVKPVPSRPMPAGKVIGKGSGNSSPSFQLIDPRKRFAELSEPRVKYTKHPPRILFFGEDSRVDSLWPSPLPAVVPPPPDGLITAERLSRRLQALKLALEDLPRQARRLARWRLRREEAKTPTFTSPLRPGRAPGSRRKPTHEVDEVLTECHWLAWEAMKPDTS
ncbi:MAG: hypothetical protein ABL936_09625 [Aestuariivirga sp.]